MSNANYWVAVMSKDRVDVAVAGGFLQLGKAAPLERLRAADCFALYSPRTADPRGEPLQAFTAIGRVRTATVYQATLPDELRPFRIDADYFGAQPASIKPLIAELSFIRNKAYWGAAFRFGMRRIPQADFAIIAAAMDCSLANTDANEPRFLAPVE